MNIWLTMFLTFVVIFVAGGLCVATVLRVTYWIDYHADRWWQTLLGIVFAIVIVSAIIPSAMFTVAWVVDQ